MAKKIDTPRYIGKTMSNPDYHHGQLRPVVGVSNYQVVRANRSNPQYSDGFGWTYNHGPDITYWKNKFFIQYLSNPVHEHIHPGQSFITHSQDGIVWSKPVVSFPLYIIPPGIYESYDGTYEIREGTYAIMHQRMSFYQAKNGKLLVTGFYGYSPTPEAGPFDKTGIGRVVREVYEDCSLGDIYFLRYNKHAGWSEDKLNYPLYNQSPDKEFIEACECLLSNSLVVQQWAEEHGDADDLIKIKGNHQAFCYYHIDEKTVIGLWKHSETARSDDGGETWSQIITEPTLIMSGAKVWGQKTASGDFVLVYNPSLSSEHRWPLALVKSKDGINFDDMMLIHGEVPPRRYSGLWKDYGPQYVRGIPEGHEVPEDGAMWLVYSVNKEDIWVSRVPNPIKMEVRHHINDNFDDIPVGGYVTDWNLYSSKWASVSITKLHEDDSNCMEFRDRDPFDYAKAERIFPKSRNVEISFEAKAGQQNKDGFYIEVVDSKGGIACRLIFDEQGFINVRFASNNIPAVKYVAGQWYKITLYVDCVNQKYHVDINGSTIAHGRSRFVTAVNSVERIVFRTGPLRREPNIDMYPYEPDLEGADEPIDGLKFYIRNVRTQGKNHKH